VEKVAPWVWSMQSVLRVWYITAGHDLPAAHELRSVRGEGESEWSLRPMLQVLRSAVLNATINPNSAADEGEVREIVQTLKKWAKLAAWAASKSAKGQDGFTVILLREMLRFSGEPGASAPGFWGSESGG